MSPLLVKLYNHRASMAPHQKERYVGKLLLECITEIERLSEAINLTLEENKHLADGNNCTLLRLKRAMSAPSVQLPVDPSLPGGG